MSLNYIYDCESYPNFFSAVIYCPDAFNQHDCDPIWRFEVSTRVNQSVMFCNFIYHIGSINGAMIGFNNEGYDYPLIHPLVQQGAFNAQRAYEISTQIIGTDWNDRFRNIVPVKDRIARQIDLYKIFHFDNPAKSTSLKYLESAMRSRNIRDLPFAPGTLLTPQQMNIVIEYNEHDVRETAKFAEIAKPDIDFRTSLSTQYAVDMTNFNDTKIGTEFFTTELERELPGVTGTRTRPKAIRQTLRSSIPVEPILLPYLKFNHPELARVHGHFKNTVITDTKGAFNLSADFHGVKLHFGTGGIHGSVAKTSVYADDDHDVIDVDVASYYPNLAVKNRLFPAHLSEIFCDIYERLYRQRLAVGRKTLEGKAIKLALNGVYGNSNNKYSCFYDPQYTMAITINGQLSLVMLAEWLCSFPGVKLVQINTDGLTCVVPKSVRKTFLDWCRYWESVTRLELEEIDYARMHVRDVNNYIGVYLDGKMKLKGAYEYDLRRCVGGGWHMNHSSLVIPQAVAEFVRSGVPVDEFINVCDDPFDFCRVVKVNRNSNLMDTNGYRLENIQRYHIAYRGAGLVKVMPPLEGSNVPRKIGIDVGFAVQPCNDINDFDWSNLNRHWYIHQANKLVDGLGIDKSDKTN